MVKKIIHQEQCLALFIPKACGNEGTQFLTDNHTGLQVGLVSRQAGESIADHRHLPIQIHYEGIRNEFIYVKKGRVTVTIFTDAGEAVHTQTMQAGESMLQLLGGHGFYFDEPTELIEVKQGPYTNKQQDKVLYETVHDSCQST